MVSLDNSTHWFAPATAEAAARVMVIAEIGVNHDGCVERAVELTRQASEVGADAVKLQLFDPNHLLSVQAGLAQYQQQEGESDVFDMLDRLKLSLDDMQRVRAEAHAQGLIFIATPFSLEDIAALDALDVDLVKIASPDAVNTPLLEAAAQLNKPMLISTGTCAIDELEPASQIVRNQGGCLLQCVSSYPTPYEEAAIGGMIALRQTFALPVGYSDHTTDLDTASLAVAAGACVIEKHFTYDCAATGPDHAASFERARFATYIQRIRRAAAMLGQVHKPQTARDDEVRSLSRQSLCAKRHLTAGQTLTRDDLTVRRPGTGIPAADFDRILGQRFTRDIPAGHLIAPDAVTPLAAAG